MTTKPLGLENFDSISAGNIELVVRQGEAYSVEVEADSNLLDNVLVKQSGQQLHISLEDGSYSDASLKVIVGLPVLSALQLQGVERAHIRGFKQAELKLSAQGIGNVMGENNHIGQLHYTGSGVTMLDFSKSKVENAKLSIDGSSDVLLSFSPDGGVLSGVIQGVSTLTYCGNPDNQIAAYGVSDVRQTDC